MTVRPARYILGPDGLWHRYGVGGYGRNVPAKWRLTRLGGTATGGTVTPPPPAPSSFVVGQTKPNASNTGWDGVTPLTVMQGDQTIPAGATWTARRIIGYVILGAGATLSNSVVEGRAKGGAFYSGLVNVGSGGTLDRVTLRPSAAALAWSSTSGLPQPAFLNGITWSGGNLTVNRCDISLVTDTWHKSGSGFINATGNFLHDYCFWNKDPDQTNAALNPGWNHADTGGQVLSGVGGDQITGNSIQCFGNADGVTWSGGQFGSGTASGGLYGTPSVALNAGYVNLRTGKVTWGNGVTYSNAGPVRNIYFGYNWIDGCNHPSGMVQFTSATGTGSSIKPEGNRFGLGGKRSSTGRMFLFSWPSGTAADWSGAPNIFDPDPAISSSTLAGKPLPAPTSGGIAVTV